MSSCGQPSTQINLCSLLSIASNGQKTFVAETGGACDSQVANQGGGDSNDQETRREIASESQAGSLLPPRSQGVTCQVLFCRHHADSGGGGAGGGQALLQAVNPNAAFLLV